MTLAAALLTIFAGFAFFTCLLTGYLISQKGNPPPKILRPLSAVSGGGFLLLWLLWSLFRNLKL